MLLLVLLLLLLIYTLFIAVGNNKVYDSTITANITLNNIINGDNVIAPSANFVNKDVGINKVININGSLTGTDSINYNLTNNSNLIRG